MNEKDRAHQSTQVIVYCTKQMSRVCIVFQIVKNVSIFYYQQISANLSKSQHLSANLSIYQQILEIISIYFNAGLNGH